MFFYHKYYLELKNRLFLTATTWVSLLTICYYYKESLLFKFIHINGDYDTLPYFIFTGVGEIFDVYLRLIFFITNQVTITMIIYHILIFVTLSLYYSEYKRLKFLFKILILTWLFSVFLLTKFVIPFSWAFFLSFRETSSHLQPTSFFFEAKITDYFKYFTTFYYICMANCQLLIILLLCLNTISKKIGTIKTFRKLFYLIFIVFSTITTPPDVFSQVFVSLTLIVTYEFLILFKYI